MTSPAPASPAASSNIGPTFAVDWEDVAPTLQTGDLILQHGTYPSSLMIEMLEDSEWSHVGMVVLASDIGLDPKKVPQLLYWESNDLTNLPDVITGKAKPQGGPMLVDLTLRLQTNAKNTTDIGFILRQLSATRTPAMLTALADFIPVMQPVGFPNEQEAVMDWILGRSANNPGDISQRCFCSQLVAASYQAMGLLSKAMVPVGYSPRDFTEVGKANFLQRAALVGHDMLFGAPPQTPASLAAPAPKSSRPARPLITRKR